MEDDQKLKENLTMKKTLFRLLTIGVVLLTVTTFSHAWGNGESRQGPGMESETTDMWSGKTGPGMDSGKMGPGRGNRGMGGAVITEGTPFSYTGEVLDTDDPCALELLTLDNETVTLHGMGPDEYWDSLNLSKPVAGDLISVTGYEVEVKEGVRNIVFTLENNGESVEVRDTEGKPMWRQSTGILSGTPFEYSGTVITASQGFGTPTVVMTESGEEMSFRIGPAMYWDSLGIAKPAEGDIITITGYTVTVHGEDVNIAAVVEIGGDVVELINEQSRPAWKKPRHKDMDY